MVLYYEGTSSGGVYETMSEIRPIDCWDNCNCGLCKELRDNWINNNKRALEWLKKNDDVL